ncbi:MAG: allantoinase [Flaviaesturariibacter sp.]|nr:allantoinase [Flaviaesturariibacter sp.]
MSVKGIYSKRCWLGGKLQEATVFFSEGIITNIIKGAGEINENIKDAGDCVLMPGVIDAHVHVNEPGRSDWEGFETATTAAAAGGITTIIDMPLNASPVTTTVEALQEKLAATSGKMHVNGGFYGGLVPGNFSELPGLIEGGVLGIKAFLTHSGIDEFPNVGERELSEAMPLLAEHGIPLLTHCELSDAYHEQALLQNPTSYAAYLSSRPKDWEDKAVDLMIGLCRKYHCPVHIVHVSSANALASIEKAKAEGLPMTAETCPHYIYFNAEDIPDAQTIYKCAPPIREASNNEQLSEALSKGVLNFLASDHSPAPPAIKELETGNLQKAWGGIAGLQVLLPASWSALKDKVSLEAFIPLLTSQPAAFLGVANKKGTISIGADADLTVWSPEEPFRLTAETLLHRHKISPYTDRQLWGKVYQTYVNGELVFDHQHKLVQKNCGKWLLRKWQR